MAAIVAAAKPEANAPVLKFPGHTQVTHLHAPVFY